MKSKLFYLFLLVYVLILIIILVPSWLSGELKSERISSTPLSQEQHILGIQIYDFKEDVASMSIYQFPIILTGNTNQDGCAVTISLFKRLPRSQETDIVNWYYDLERDLPYGELYSKTDHLLELCPSDLPQQPNIRLAFDEFFLEEPILNQEISFQVERSSRLFPFDKRTIEIAYGITSTTPVLPPQIKVETFGPEWNESFNIINSTAKDKETILIEETPVELAWLTTPVANTELLNPSFQSVTTLHIDLTRPPAKIIFTGLIFAFIYIVTFLIAFVDELGSSLEAAIGILLGLWGIRAILVPENILGPTMVDTMILSVYVLIPIAIVTGIYRRGSHDQSPP